MTTPVRNRQIKTGIITAFSVFGAVLCLLGLSAIDNADGTPWLESTLIGQTLAMLGVIAAAVLPSLLATRRDAAVVRDQLENTHVDTPDKISNVRDDLDYKNEVVLRAVERVAQQNRDLAEKVERKFDGVYAEFRGARKDIGRATDQADRAASAADRLRDSVQEYKDKTDGRLESIETKLDGIVEVATGSIPVVDTDEETP